MPGRHIPGFNVGVRCSTVFGWVWEIWDDNDKLVDMGKGFNSAPAARKDGEAEAMIRSRKKRKEQNDKVETEGS